MGTNGVVYRWAKGQIKPEIIDNSDEGPQNLGDLQEIRTIGSRAYVVGMSRTAYRCDGEDRWVRIEKGLRCPKGDDSDAGLTSIHGFRENDVYAVGWEGEIWHFDGKRWAELDSPTTSCCSVSYAAVTKVPTYAGKKASCSAGMGPPGM